jgi:hypothetical protein
MAKKSPKTPEITLTPEEAAIILAMREKPAPAPTTAHQELANAFIEAIERTKPPTKKNSFNRPKHGPFDPKPGEIKPKLRRVTYMHGNEQSEDTLTGAEIELLNKVKPGSYCGGFVRVIKRKDRGIDIDYPIRTASQRMKLPNQFGIITLTDLCNRLIAEAARPKEFKVDEDDE